MTLSLTFQTFKEKLPKNWDRIAFFDCEQGIKNLQQGTVSYQWVLMDMPDGRIDTDELCEFREGEQWDENFLLIEEDTSDYDKFRWKLAYEIYGDRQRYLMLADDLDQNIYWISLEDINITMPQPQRSTSYLL